MKPRTKPERAKSITSSSPAKSDLTHGYTYCESVHATGNSPWHIRKLDQAGLKLTGGLTTPSLCGRVKPFNIDAKDRGFGGWDLNVKIMPVHDQHTCAACLAEYLRQTGS